MKRSLLTLALAAAGFLGIGASPVQVHAASTGGTIADNVKSCLNGGWQDQRDAMGQHFATQQTCVIYALQGGQFASSTGEYSFTNFAGAFTGGSSGGIVLSGQGSFLGTCTKSGTQIASNALEQAHELPCAWTNKGVTNVSGAGRSVSGSGTWTMSSIVGATPSDISGTWKYGPHVALDFDGLNGNTGEVGEGFLTLSSGACRGATVRVAEFLVAFHFTSGPTAGGPITLPALIALVQTPQGNSIQFLTIGPQATLSPSKASAFSMSC